jgi:hypothetical protein
MWGKRACIHNLIDDLVCCGRANLVSNASGIRENLMANMGLGKYLNRLSAIYEGLGLR